MDIPGDRSTTVFLNPGDDDITSSISPAGDVDYIGSNLTAGLSYAFTPSTSNDNLTVMVRLRDSSDIPVPSVFGLPDFGIVNSVSSVPLAVTATETNTYYLKVGGAYIQGIGNYSIAINDNDTILNNTATTHSVEAGSSFSSAIDVAGDVDYISTVLTEGLTYGFKLSTDTDKGVTLSLWHSSDEGWPDFSTWGTSTYSFWDGFTATETGTHFLRFHVPGYVETGNYTITINDDDNILNSTATDRTIGSAEVFASAIDVWTDVDYVAVELDAGTTYNFQLSTTEADLVLELELRDSTDGYVDGAGADSTSPGMLSYSATATGTYYLRIEGINPYRAGEYTLVSSTDRDDVLIGTDRDEAIFGGTGDDIIQGGAGGDQMTGGAGDDTYSIDNSLDVVIEMAGGGFDNVYSSVDYFIDEAQEIESGLLTGNAVQLRGSSSDNRLTGNAFDNVLDGKGGTDYLLGLGGNDIFQISREANATDIDVIGDFEGAGVIGGDRLVFAIAEFGADGIVTQLSQTSFNVSRADGSGAQQFIIANLAPDNNGLIADDFYFA